MNIDCHFIAFNESETIHLTIKHYQQFCRQVYVYDNFSTDNTREIAESMGCIVQPFGIAGQLNDAEYIKVKNNCWKGSDADWVIVCDADEILAFVDYTSLKNAGVTVIKPQGYNMFSEYLPKENWGEVTFGIADNNYSKLACFDPKAVTEIGYIYGCHEAKPQGRIVYGIGGAMLLHYKNVGGAKRLADRHALYASRMSPINKRFKLGHQYEEPRETTIKYFHDHLALAKPLW